MCLLITKFLLKHLPFCKYFQIYTLHENFNSIMLFLNAQTVMHVVLLINK